MHPFLTTYTTRAIPALTKETPYKSTYLIPRVTKVVINVGLGDVQGNNKAIDELQALVARISGQKAILTKARKAIAGFKIRQGMDVGMKVTLRGERMHDFLAKLATITLPRTRDFRGLKVSSVTSDGNMNLGIRDVSIFPEAPQDGTMYGIKITVVSTAKNQSEALTLFRELGFPLLLDGDTVS